MIIINCCLLIVEVGLVIGFQWSANGWRMMVEQMSVRFSTIRGIELMNRRLSI